MPERKKDPRRVRAALVHLRDHRDRWDIIANIGFLTLSGLVTLAAWHWDWHALLWCLPLAGALSAVLGLLNAVGRYSANSQRIADVDQGESGEASDEAA